MFKIRNMATFAVFIIIGPLYIYIYIYIFIIIIIIFFFTQMSIYHPNAVLVIMGEKSYCLFSFTFLFCKRQMQMIVININNV